MKISRIVIIIILIIAIPVLIFSFALINNRNSRDVAQEQRETVNADLEIQKTKYGETRVAWIENIKKASVNDSDLDGLSNEEETKLTTNPESADTDGDGLLDSMEVSLYKTNPLKKDDINKLNKLITKN